MRASLSADSFVHHLDVLYCVSNIFLAVLENANRIEI
jgi:hypothetical protein